MLEISYKLENIGFADLSPSMFSYELWDSGTKHLPTTHNYYIFVFVVEGNAIFGNGKTTFELKKNQAILFFPDDVMSFESPENTPFRIIRLGFYGMRAMDFINRISISRENPVFSYPVSEELMGYFAAKINTESGGDFQALSALFKVFAYIYTRPTDIKNSYVIRAIEYIDKNIDKPLRIAELSASLGISRVYLYKAFDEVLGMAPKEYVTNRKMIMAYDALRSKKVSISEAAVLVGYHDQFAFSKLFKSKYQMSPRDIAMGKTPYITVIDDEAGECIWPSELSTLRSKNGKFSFECHPYYDEKKDITEGWLIRAGHVDSKPLPRTLDISILTDNGKKGYLTFYIFIENTYRITNWCLNNEDWIRFGSSLDWDTDFQYWKGWHKQIKKEGWNKIVLPFGDSQWGHIVGSPDYKKFCSFSIILSIEHTLRIFIDDIRVVPGD